MPALGGTRDEPNSPGGMWAVAKARNNLRHAVPVISLVCRAHPEPLGLLTICVNYAPWIVKCKQNSVKPGETRAREKRPGAGARPLA